MVKKDVGSQNGIPVVPFSLMVEIIQKVHNQLGHIGRHKLIEIVSSNFWHPAIDKVARDICACCVYCQHYKTSSQPLYPPTIKIRANHPFDLVAIDLLQLPKSVNRNVALIMVIDHFSKFLYAAPIPDKSAKTVAAVFRNKILPFMIKTPNRIITDNGPEFRSEEFVSTLDKLNIQHIHSTRYRAQGNGAVERSNRTIIEILKGLINDQPEVWDKELARAVVIYNGTYHSELGQSPSQYLLSKSFNINNNLPVDNNIIETWKEGHPKFNPYRIGDKVLVKIQRIGHSLKYKFNKKYVGPYKIIKVQSNGVSYEILKDDQQTVLKVHHKQIKIWKAPPKYLEKFLINIEDEEIPEQLPQRRTKARVARIGAQNNWDTELISGESDSTDVEQEYDKRGRRKKPSIYKKYVDKETQTISDKNTSERNPERSLRDMFKSNIRDHQVNFSGFSRLSEEVNDVNKASSPILSRQQLQASLDLSPIHNTSGGRNEDKVSEHILSVVEQSLNFQEDIVDILLEAEERNIENEQRHVHTKEGSEGEQELSLAKRAVVGQTREMNRQVENPSQVGLDPLFVENSFTSFKGFCDEEEHFQGFGQDTSAKQKTTAALEALKTMKNQITFSRSRILGDCSDSVTIIRRRLSNIDLSDDKCGDCIALIDEVSDTLSPLPRRFSLRLRQHSLVKTSMGKIPEYPRDDWKN